MKINFKKLHPNAVLPSYAKDGDAALDLTAVSCEFSESIFVIKTGLAVEIPKGYLGLIFMRSSAYKIACVPLFANCIGVIDSGYRGELIANVRILNRELMFTMPYQKGERFAQLVILPYPTIESEWAETLSESERGEGGFGSTGK